MKPHKHAALIKAWADGAEIQWRDPKYDDSGWEDIKEPSWVTCYQYRIKPEEKENNWVHSMVIACRQSPNSADINVVKLYHIIEQIRADEREACAEIAKFATMHCIAEAIMRRGESDEHQRTS